jgi:hypothetical protein
MKSGKARHLSDAERSGTAFYRRLWGDSNSLVGLKRNVAFDITGECRIIGDENDRPWFIFGTEAT